MRPSDKIARLLSERGWSQAQLARKVSVSPTSISNVIAGGDTSVSVGLSIANALEVQAEWLWGDAEWPPPSSSKDITLAPDIVIMEEALRRKRAVADAFEELLVKYRTLRAGLIDAMKDPKLTPEMGDSYIEQFQRNYELLGESFRSYSDALEHWLELDARWQKIKIYHVDDPDWNDFGAFARALAETETANSKDDKLMMMRKILDMWGLSSRSLLGPDKTTAKSPASKKRRDRPPRKQ